jgi:hypothetical protein
VSAIEIEACADPAVNAGVRFPRSCLRLAATMQGLYALLGRAHRRLADVTLVPVTPLELIGRTTMLELVPAVTVCTVQSVIYSPVFRERHWMIEWFASLPNAAELGVHKTVILSLQPFWW